MCTSLALLPTHHRGLSHVDTPAAPRPIAYSIQTLRHAGRADEYRLWVEHRGNRGLIQAPEVDEIRGATPEASGVVLRFVAEDGRHEQLGTAEHPLPRELFDAAQSSDGLVIIYLDPHENRIVNGQVLWLEVTSEPRDYPRVRG